MNRKGQDSNMGMIGAILGMFMAVIVALAIFSGGIIPIIGQTTTLTTFANQSIVYPTASLTVDLSGREVTNFVLVNASNGNVIPASNFTLTNNVLANGVLTARLNNSGLQGVNDSVGTNPLATYTTESIDYVDSSGARSMILLIAVFSALAIMVVALTPTMRSGLMSMFGR